MHNKSISIEINEVNYEWLQFYVNKNSLNNLKKLFNNHFIKTFSEKKIHELEPWIQWPSFYTGKSYKDHRCFHLGDCQMIKNWTIYDFFQKNNHSVLAFSPINCTFKIKNNSILIHDPWSNLGVIGGDDSLVKLWDAICYFVNENSNKSFKINFLWVLFKGVLKYGRFRNIFLYLKFIFLSIFFKWSRAIFLDLFIFDIFYSYQLKNNFKYSSIFLNAGAHIQHHYFFDSKFYKKNKGINKNLNIISSFFTKTLDPLFQVYYLYNHIAFDINKLAFHNNILVSSGLQQKENQKPYYQFRIKDYNNFFNLFSIKTKSIQKKMSRDVYLYFNNLNDLSHAHKLLINFKINNEPIFQSIPSKTNKSIFLQVSYKKNLNDFIAVKLNSEFFDLRKHFVLVSYENGIHQTEGWHLNNFFKFNKSVIKLDKLTNYLFNFTKKL